MKIKQYEIWLANLDPKIGTEPRKTRPVVIIQTDLLNDFHPSTIVCPVTSNVKKDIKILRIHLKKGKLDKPSDILIDQIRSIDNKRFIKKLGILSASQIQNIKTNFRIILDI